jgi:hypothetical protein
MTNITTYLARGACLSVGAALAGISMHASYEAAAKVGNDYLMIAAPLVALAAPSTAVFIEIACEARQYLKALALLLVFGLCSATVFYTAAERNHDGRAVGEAQRIASRTTAVRAERDLVEAKAARAEATAKADKVRGKDTPKAKAVLASETAAIARVTTAEQAVRDASSHAVTDSDIQQATWVMPLAIDFASVVMLWAGFGLGKIQPRAAAPVIEKDVPVEAVPAKTVKAKDPKRVRAGRKAAKTTANKKAQAVRDAALASGTAAPFRKKA